MSLQSTVVLRIPPTPTHTYEVSSASRPVTSRLDHTTAWARLALWSYLPPAVFPGAWATVKGSWLCLCAKARVVPTLAQGFFPDFLFGRGGAGGILHFPHAGLRVS